MRRRCYLSVFKKEEVINSAPQTSDNVSKHIRLWHSNLLFLALWVLQSLRATRWDANLYCGITILHLSGHNNAVGCINIRTAPAPSARRRATRRRPAWLYVRYLHAVCNVSFVETHFYLYQHKCNLYDVRILVSDSYRTPGCKSWVWCFADGL